MDIVRHPGGGVSSKEMRDCSFQTGGRRYSSLLLFDTEVRKARSLEYASAQPFSRLCQASLLFEDLAVQVDISSAFIPWKSREILIFFRLLLPCTVQTRIRSLSLFPSYRFVPPPSHLSRSLLHVARHSTIPHHFKTSTLMHKV